MLGHSGGAPGSVEPGKFGHAQASKVALGIFSIRIGNRTVDGSSWLPPLQVCSVVVFVPETSSKDGIDKSPQFQGPLQFIPDISAVLVVVVTATLAERPSDAISLTPRSAPTVTVTPTENVAEWEFWQPKVTLASSHDTSKILLIEAEQHTVFTRNTWKS